MVTLKDLHRQKNFIRAEQLEIQWWVDRGLPISRNMMETMRYIERLEEELAKLKPIWTTKKPTREGWWWLQQDSEDLECIEIYNHTDDGLCVAGERRIGHTLDDFCMLMAEDHDIRWSSESIAEPEEVK